MQCFTFPYRWNNRVHLEITLPLQSRKRQRVSTYLVSQLPTCLFVMACVAQGHSTTPLDGKLALKDQGIYSSRILSLRYVSVALSADTRVSLQAVCGLPREAPSKVYSRPIVGQVPPVLAERGARQSSLHCK